MAVFKSYPSASDATLYLAFVPIHDELSKCKKAFCTQYALDINPFIIA